jgi:hypothetical protein
MQQVLDAISIPANRGDDTRLVIARESASFLQQPDGGVERVLIPHVGSQQIIERSSRM